jgi:hypothetical protein
MVDDSGIDLVAEIDTALEGSAVRIGIRYLVEDQRGLFFENDGGLSDVLAKKE